MTMILRSLAPVALLLAPACSHDSSIGENVPPDGTVQDQAPDAPTITIPTCDNSTMFSITGPTPADDQNATVAPTIIKIIVGDFEPELILGFRGVLPDGTFFTLMRDGDEGDGSLGEIGTYDASEYPHHMFYRVAMDVGASCEFDGGCPGWTALSGAFTVLSLEPVYQGWFSLGTLVKGEGPSNSIPGMVTGCFAVPNP
ncbi:MAG: hypothetical protein AB7O24_00715 [Kofleriaceae bacterium]